MFLYDEVRSVDKFRACVEILDAVANSNFLNAPLPKASFLGIFVIEIPREGWHTTRGTWVFNRFLPRLSVRHSSLACVTAIS